MHYNAIVLGGGLYGCKIALALRAAGVRRVLLVEPQRLISGATTVNQNRVHGGYHYPRSYQTAESAQRNYTRFLADHAPAIWRNKRHVYGIAEGSLTTPYRFEQVMESIGALLTPVDPSSLFTSKIVAAYEVEEVVFDIVKLRNFLTDQLEAARVERALAHGWVTGVDEARVSVELRPMRGMRGEKHTADYLFNCTYRNLAYIGAAVKTRLQYEWCEVAMVNAPPALQETDITIMDGPFWSLMAYPSTGGHALTHVEHTVHHRWFSDGQPPKHLPYDTHVERMRADAALYCPAMEYAQTPGGSLWTTRVVLAANEKDDGRPILWEHDERSPRVISVLGSKFNSVYDATAMIEQGEWRERRHRPNVRREGRRVLVGATGFVGGNLDVPGRFTDRITSANLGDLRGHYRQIVIAAPSGEKWKANADPDADMDSVAKLQTALYNCTADEVRLVSTIDVTGGTPYGDHRAFLEQVVRQHFPCVRVLRLPGLYGPGLKKNALYDAIHRRPSVPYHPESTFQWFDVRRVWEEFEAMEPGVRDILPEPIPMQWVYDYIGSFDLDWCRKFNVVKYAKGPYTETAEQVKEGLKRWLQTYLS